MRCTPLGSATKCLLRVYTSTASTSTRKFRQHRQPQLLRLTHIRLGRVCYRERTAISLPPPKRHNIYTIVLELFPTDVQYLFYTGLYICAYIILHPQQFRLSLPFTKQVIRNLRVRQTHTVQYTVQVDLKRNKIMIRFLFCFVLVSVFIHPYQGQIAAWDWDTRIFMEIVYLNGTEGMIVELPKKCQRYSHIVSHICNQDSYPFTITYT